MNLPQCQGELFEKNNHLLGLESHNIGVTLSKELIQSWQEKIHLYQYNLFQGLGSDHQQTSLFDEKSTTLPANKFAPLTLTPLPLSFWRWPQALHHGPAIYVVMDRLIEQNSYLMLYIGETISAEKRWKGEHDCKAYLANYSEALKRAKMNNQLSIRFWTDVPKSTKQRRTIEQDLIKLWLPPFNKETRSRWETPFTAEIG